VTGEEALALYQKLEPPPRLRGEAPDDSPIAICIASSTPHK
jgi:hypothetical protein